MLGTFRYVGKPDRKHNASNAAVRCVVHMFVMHVAEELPTWPEHSERQRVWVRVPSPMLHACAWRKRRVHPCCWTPAAVAAQASLPANLQHFISS